MSKPYSHTQTSTLLYILLSGRVATLCTSISLYVNSIRFHHLMYPLNAKSQRAKAIKNVIIRQAILIHIFQSNGRRISTVAFSFLYGIIPTMASVKTGILKSTASNLSVVIADGPIIQKWTNVNFLIATEWLDRMSHWKWSETKQAPSWARSGHQLSCCLFFLHFLS